MTRRIFISLLTCLVLAFQTASAQGLWETVKSAASGLYSGAKDLYAECQYEVPVTHRTFTNLIPDSWLTSQSAKEYKSFLRSSSSPASTNQKYVAQVNRVSSKLQAAVTRLYRMEGRSDELKNFHWETHVVKNKDNNAWCMPGGKIVVYDGMFECASVESSLAIVIGHEIAHALAKHSAEQMTKGAITTLGVTVAYGIISGSDMSSGSKTMSKVLAAAGGTLMSLKFSRRDEAEADRIGLVLAAMAGYDLDAAIPFWKRMGEKSSLKTHHDFFSTHPSNYNRIENIKSYLPEARRYRNK